MHLVLRQHQRQEIEASEALEFSNNMTAKERQFWQKQARTAKRKLNTLLKSHPEYRANLQYEETL